MIRDTLLIIDDSELDRAILNEIFKNLFHVECVANAAQGMQYLREHAEQVCAVLLDLCLERRGAGFDALHTIQDDPVSSNLPVVLITADAHEKDVRSGVERGAVDFLAKPVDPHAVQKRVCQMVRATWPPMTTILDQMDKSKAKNPPDAAESPAAPLTPGELWEKWVRKLEAFCRFSSKLDVKACLQLGVVTGQLARRYVQLYPELGLTQDDAELIGMAAVFCDIGLLGIPDEAAMEKDQKSGKSDLYYQHTQLGYELFSQEMSGEPLLRYAAEIALWHHKNINGSGYPLEKDGSLIPVSAQLTRTALRLLLYLRHYQYGDDRMERSLRMLKSEVGSIIAPELYHTAELEADAILAMM